MQKDQAYHEAAIAYNEGLAEAAEKLVETLGNEEVQRWCRAVAKQHRFHAKRHQASLEKFVASSSPDEEPAVEQIPDGLDVPENVVETPEELATKTPTEIIQEAPEVKVLEDGCITFHNPSDPNCSFSPATGGTNA